MSIFLFKTGAPALLAAGLLAASTAPVAAADYKIGPAHSFVEFKTLHLGFSWLHGRFNTVEGSLKFDPSAGPETQEIEVIIDTASVDTNHAERDKHLRSSDFLNVEEYPTATFKSTGYDGDEDGGTLTGELTLHGVTKPISFEIKKIGEGDDPWGGYRAGFEGSYTLTRSDFGMDYDLGPGALEVELGIYVEAIRQ
ncbi:YceI family protein [Pelagibius sp.]|uniref:YceI family protein n=1 Tax=Pelagibius sp. TaxID=1931238 RepID=UPI003BB167D9